MVWEILLSILYNAVRFIAPYSNLLDKKYGIIPLIPKLILRKSWHFGSWKYFQSPEVSASITSSTHIDCDLILPYLEFIVLVAAEEVQDIDTTACLMNEHPVFSTSPEEKIFVTETDRF